MKQFFILGRNPALSRQEIISYMGARAINYEEILFHGNLLLIETEKQLPIQNFGGIIRSGKISFEGTFEEFENHVKNVEIVPSDKFTYAIYGNIEPDILKDKFKKMRKKAVQKHGRTRIQLQQGDLIELAKADFHIFMYEEGDILYQGLSDQEYDYSGVKKRDMNKPIRRQELAISPRLSKILINLSGATSSSVLLDPFCGVGAILSEALVQGIEVHGIDKDHLAINDANINLKWLKSEFKIEKSYFLEKGDSRSAPNLKFDAIATETPLGKLVKKKLNEREAKKIVQDFQGFIIPILSRLKKVKKASARIAITFPKVRDMTVNLDKILEKTGLKIVVKPLEESRQDQHIGRQIIVFK